MRERERERERERKREREREERERGERGEREREREEREEREERDCARDALLDIRQSFCSGSTSATLSQRLNQSLSVRLHQKWGSMLSESAQNMDGAT